MHGGADDGSAAVVGQVVVGGGGDEGADQGDAERRAELLGDVVERPGRTRVARFDTLLPDVGWSDPVPVPGADVVVVRQEPRHRAVVVAGVAAREGYTGHT